MAWSTAFWWEFLWHSMNSNSQNGNETAHTENSHYDSTIVLISPHHWINSECELVTSGNPKWSSWFGSFFWLVLLSATLRKWWNKLTLQTSKYFHRRWADIFAWLRFKPGSGSVNQVDCHRISIKFIHTPLEYQVNIQRQKFVTKLCKPLSGRVWSPKCHNYLLNGVCKVMWFLHSTCT